MNIGTAGNPTKITTCNSAAMNGGFSSASSMQVYEVYDTNEQTQS